MQIFGTLEVLTRIIMRLKKTNNNAIRKNQRLAGYEDGKNDECRKKLGKMERICVSSTNCRCNLDG